MRAKLRSGRDILDGLQFRRRDYPRVVQSERSNGSDFSRYAAGYLAANTDDQHCIETETGELGDYRDSVA